jgi:hypothetical protein
MPIPFASVQVKDRNTGTSADTLGNFHIRIRAGNTLFVNALGYVGDTIVVADQSGLSVILRGKIKSLEGIVITGGEQKKGIANDPMNTIASHSAAATISDYTQNEQIFNGQVLITPRSTTPTATSPQKNRYDASQAFISNAPANTFYKMSALPAFSIKENTRGNRYLLGERWAGGTVTTFSDDVVNNPALSFNYDKMNQGLYATKDGQTVIEITKERVKAFTINDAREGKQYVFERLACVDSLQFFEAIVGMAPGKYSLYKQVKTRFEKSNYHSDGMVESGKNYDEYVDDYQYYLLLPGGKTGKKLPELKIKALSKMLNSESPVAAAYLSAHKYDPVDEAFLLDMVRAMNQ